MDNMKTIEDIDPDFPYYIDTGKTESRNVEDIANGR